MISKASFKLFMLSLLTDKRKGFLAALMKAVLYLLSLFYAMALSIVKFLYFKDILKRKSVARRVISVGNITMGGTGKTPTVEYISKHLKEKGKKTAVIIRGYGDDEHKLLSQNAHGCDVYVGRDRIKLALEAIRESKPDMLLLDDGYQHWRLRRNLDLVVIDSTNPFGNSQLIPRGILREPISSLKRADMVLITKVDSPKHKLEELRQKISSLNPNADIFESEHSPKGFRMLDEGRRDLSCVKGEKVLAVSAIGDPEYFRWMLSNQGAKVVEHLIFPDHHLYTSDEVKGMVEEASAKGCKFIVTTQKDMIKLKPLIKSLEKEISEKGIEVLYLKIELEVKERNRFIERLLSMTNVK